MSNAYAAGSPPNISLDDIRAACERMAALPPVESDITVAPDVWNALRARVPVETGAPPIDALNVHVDDRLPAGAWHKGRPR